MWVRSTPMKRYCGFVVGNGIETHSLLTFSLIAKRSSLIEFKVLPGTLRWLAPYVVWVFFVAQNSRWIGEHPGDHEWVGFPGERLWVLSCIYDLCISEGRGCQTGSSFWKGGAWAPYLSLYSVECFPWWLIYFLLLIWVYKPLCGSKVMLPRFCHLESRSEGLDFMS